MIMNHTYASGIPFQHDNLLYPYTKFYKLANHFHPTPQKTLMLGGAGFTYPRYFLQHNPKAKIDVIEIDPGVTQLARQYFRLTEDSRMHIIHQDARIFLNHTDHQYDILLGDAYNYYSIPYQLTSQQAVKHMYSLLADDGVAVMNLISTIDEDFLKAEYQTFRTVFPQVYIFPVDDPVSSVTVQNIMLVALKSKETPTFHNDDQEIDDMLSHRWQQEIPSDVGLLTDEWAPVDYFQSKLLSKKL